jgi:hypothetical protein
MNRDELFKMHEDTCAAALATMRKKNHDYAASSDPFQNFNGSEIYGIPRVKGLLLRVGDKLQRINTFVEKGTLKVDNEGVNDAIEDVINYMILAKGMIVEEANKKEKAKDVEQRPATPEIRQFLRDNEHLRTYDGKLGDIGNKPSSILGQCLKY